MANNEEVTGLPLACDQSRQAENVQDMTKVPLYHQKKTYSRIKNQLCQDNTKKKQKFDHLFILPTHNHKFNHIVHEKCLVHSNTFSLLGVEIKGNC